MSSHNIPFLIYKKIILNYPKSAVTECFPRDSRTSSKRGWSGGAMVLGKPPVPGRPTILITVGQGFIALAVGAGWACLDICTLIYPFFPLSPSLLEGRYRLKYCLKGPLNPKPPTNQQVRNSRGKRAIHVRITRGYQKVLSLTWKEPEIWIYSALFFNVVPFQLHTLVPSSFPVINTRSVEVNILVP